MPEGRYEPRTFRAHIRYPDDPPVSWVRRADGTVEQVEGVEREVEIPGYEWVGDGPTMTLRIEHSPEDGPTWTELKT